MSESVQRNRDYHAPDGVAICGFELLAACDWDQERALPNIEGMTPVPCRHG